jgi:diguanylate cyclase (GGDEF)-like protein
VFLSQTEKTRKYLWDAAFVGALLGLVSFVDLEIGRPLHVSLGVLALAPVLLATHRLGLEVGLATAIIATLLLFAEQRWQAAVTHIAVWNIFVHGIFLSVSALLLGRYQIMQARLQEAASIDPLTGIANRRALTQAAEVELRRQARTLQPLSVLHLDLDNFKRLNDAHGHHEGDKVLAAVARVLASGRSTDIAARTGGDEFVMLLPDTGQKAARAMVDRLRERISAAMSANPRWQHVSCSVGIATFLQPPLDTNTLVAAADESMYEVKRHCKNGVRQVVIDGDETTEIRDPREPHAERRRATA